MTNICFLIRSLGAGGAERQLVETVKLLDSSRFLVTVVTFYSGGTLCDEILRIPGVRLVSLRKRGRWDILLFMFRWFRIVRSIRPIVFYGYMAPANQICSLTAKLLGSRAVWGIRTSELDLAKYDNILKILIWVEGKLSPMADLIIFNSHKGLNDFSNKYGRKKNALVISNGIDTKRFRHDYSARAELRASWSVHDNDLLIGQVGRLHPMKDYPTLIKAASIVVQKYKNVKFLFVGTGDFAYQQSLRELAESLQVENIIIWAGLRRDVEKIYNALDVFVLSSAYGEGFPNVLGEAMASELPCVATDVGDSRFVLDQPSWIVPPKDPDTLAEKILHAIALSKEERNTLIARGRARIDEYFSVTRLVVETESALAKLHSGL